MTDETKHRLRERFERLLSDTDTCPQTTIADLESMLLHLQKQVATATCEEVSREKSDEECKEPGADELSLAPPTKVACPHCLQGNAWYKGERTRHILTMGGSLLFKRRYYYCRHCKKGICPSDSARALPQNTRFTTCVQQEVAFLCACLPFEQATKTLSRLCHLVLSPASAQRLCREQAHSMASDFVQSRDKRMLPLAFVPLSSLPQSLPKPEVLYVMADGVHTPMQKGSWQEMKVGVVRSLFKDGRVDQESQFVNHLGNCHDFGAQWESLAINAGSLMAKHLVMIGDGAVWLWNIATQRFPQAVQILDFWHALEYVGKVARVAFGEGTQAGKVWLLKRSAEMKKSAWVCFFAALELVRDLAGDCVADVVRYFGNNSCRMDYALYLRSGFCIGSGLAESSCKRIVTQRLKGSGMHWSEGGAQGMAGLRCLILGNQWDAFTCFWDRVRGVATLSPLL